MVVGGAALGSFTFIFLSFVRGLYCMGNGVGKLD